MKNKSFTIGRSALIFAALFPLLIGLYQFFGTWLGTAPVSHAVKENMQSGFVNYLFVLSASRASGMMMAGFTMLVLTLIELPKRSKTAFAIIVALTLFIGLSDSVATLIYYIRIKDELPIAVLPTLCGIIGCLLCYPTIFRESDSAKN